MKIQLDYLRKRMEKQLIHHDFRTYEHCRSVAFLMHSFAQWMNLPKQVVYEAYYTGYFQDIGKLWIPRELLQKDGLQTGEREVLQMHAHFGEFFISKPAEEIALYIRHHHEWYDGTGYPDRLKGNAIPFVSRMVSICDAFDAMIHERPYSPRMLPAYALQELERYAGTQFDPSLVSQFTDFAREQLLPLELFSEQAVIKDFHQGEYPCSTAEEVQKLVEQLPYFLSH